ncbi:MAG: alpha-ketoglutarate-dependent dioxygenase AlkB [Burkholderiaceae bacterium]
MSSLSVSDARIEPTVFGDRIVLLPGFAPTAARVLFEGIDQVSAAAPFRQMRVPGGHAISVAMTSCGPLGWVADETGYRYSALHPQSGQDWPEMPDAFSALAHAATLRAGFAGFLPDVCLINRYQATADAGVGDYLIGIGVEFWLDLTADDDDFTTNKPIGADRLRRVTGGRNWFGFSSASDADLLRLHAGGLLPTGNGAGPLAGPLPRRGGAAPTIEGG